MLRILRTRGLDRRIYVPVQVASIFGIDPAQLATQLNEHRSAMNHVIMNHAGIVMQYMGDAVFAVFVPTTSPGEHADQAFAAAQEMHWQQQQINKAWSSRGQPIFGMGIGLSTGQVAWCCLA